MLAPLPVHSVARASTLGDAGNSGQNKKIKALERQIVGLQAAQNGGGKGKGKKGNKGKGKGKKGRQKQGQTRIGGFRHTRHDTNGNEICFAYNSLGGCAAGSSCQRAHVCSYRQVWRVSSQDGVQGALTRGSAR